MVEHVGEQQVVHVAAVAGHVNYLVAVVGQLAHALGVMDVDALIEAVPGKAQHAVAEADHLIGEVGRNLFHQRDGVLLRLLVRNLLAARLVFYRFGDGLGGQQLIEQILTGGQARADGRQALAGEVHARHAGQLLGNGFIRAVFIRHPAHREGRREAHEAVAAEPGDGEKLLHAVKHTQRRVLFALFAPRRTTEHHRDRHHLHVQLRVAAVQIEIVVEQLNGLFFRRVIGKHARTAVDKDIARQQRAVDLQRFQRIRQIVRQALGAQGQQIGF